MTAPQASPVTQGQARTAQPLDADCQTVLKQADAYSVALEDRTDFVIYDEEGEYMFTVSDRINVSDLSMMLRVHYARFREGRKAGRDEAHADLRALLGVDEAIAKATGAAS